MCSDKDIYTMCLISLPLYKFFLIKRVKRTKETKGCSNLTKWKISLRFGIHRRTSDNSFKGFAEILRVLIAQSIGNITDRFIPDLPATLLQYPLFLPIYILVQMNLSPFLSSLRNNLQTDATGQHNKLRSVYRIWRVYPK